MGSFATSVLKNMGFPEVSRSIASGAENGVRLANAKENFANTATSTRGKKRTHGLVFENDKRNDNGRYVRYYRSPQFAVKNYVENPSTREMNRVKLARFSNASRKATYERAVADRNVAAVRRLLDERFVPSKELAIATIQALACRPNGLDVVQRLVSTHPPSGWYQEWHDQVYTSIVTCSKARAQDLIRLFLKAGITPTSQPWNNDGTAALLDWAIHAGLDTALLKKLVSTDKDYKTNVMAKVLTLQVKRHATGGMPAGLKRFVASLGDVDTPLFERVFAIAPRPARIVRWLVEDAGYRSAVDDVLLALHFRHMQVAVYLATRHAWSPADRKVLAVFFHDNDGNLTWNDVNLSAKTSFFKNARAPAYARILRDIAGLRAPPKQRPPVYRRNDDPLVRIYNQLRNGNALMYGQQNTYPPRHVRVHKPSVGHGGDRGKKRDVVILQRPNNARSSSPPDRIASKADLEAWQRRHGILRGTTRPNRSSGNAWTVQTQNPLVPLPTNARNHRNSRYLKANAAARRIQAAFRTATTKKKTTKTTRGTGATARGPARKK
jgi:hypothetical protein